MQKRMEEMGWVKVDIAPTFIFLLFTSTSILRRILDFRNWGTRLKKDCLDEESISWKSKVKAEKYAPWLAYKCDITASDTVL
jgi:hypothetical protein